MNPLNNNKPQVPNVQYLKGFIDRINGMANPESLIAQMAQQNPAINQVMQMCRGKNPKDMFFEECKRRNIDPNAILNQLK